MSLPDRFTRIDELTRPDHHWLSDEDRCYFLGEYAAGRGYSYSQTNNLISNFKKPMDRRGKPEWKYKEDAIDTIAAAFRRAVVPIPPEGHAFVPMPPSKALDDPLYDDRLVRMLRIARHSRAWNVLELLVQDESTIAAHERPTGERPRPPEIAERYRIKETGSTLRPKRIAIVDDILTTGAHYSAAKLVLASRFPRASFLGLFIARRVPDHDPDGSE